MAGEFVLKKMKLILLLQLYKRNLWREVGHYDYRVSTAKQTLSVSVTNTLNIYIPSIYYAISKFIEHNAEISCCDIIQLWNGSLNL